VKELTNDSRFHNWLVSYSKTDIVPAMKDSLLEGSVDQFEDTLEHTLGNVNFGAGPMEIKSFTIPLANISVTFSDPSNVIFVWSRIAAAVKPFDWWYEKARLPKLADKGQADASISDTVISVTTYVTKDDEGFPCLKPASATVLIGQLEVGISGSGADKIYKLVASAMKKALKSRFQSQLSDYISEYFDDNAQDWLDTYVKDKLHKL